MSSINCKEGNVKLKYALTYAQMDLFVFPLHSVSDDGTCPCGKENCEHPGKHPRIKNWQNDCSIDPQVIEAWWDTWPNANVGIATGKSKIIVIDIDPRHGGVESFKELRNKRSLDQPLASHTGGGGYHLIYRAPDGGVKNRTEVLPGIDVRGVGGYIVAPPSNHLSGYCYRWSNETIENHQFGPMPDWLAKAITSKSAKDREKTSVKNNVRRNAADILKGVPDGERDDTLFRYACQLRRRGMGYDEAKILLLEAARNSEPPFPEDEMIKCLDSAWSYDQGGGDETKDPISFSDLLETDIPPIKYIVPGLLPQGVILVSGDPKVGKSWMAMQISLGVATGGQVLGSFEVTDTAAVLHLGLEDSDPLFKERLGKLVCDISCPQNAFFTNRWLRFPKGLENLKDFLDQNADTGLVVIDCLETIRDTKANSQTLFSYDYNTLLDLRKIASEYAIAILVIHHNRKMAADNPFHKVSGSLGLTAVADQTMVLEKARGGGSATMSVTGRSVRESTLNLSFDQDSCVWSVINPDEVTTRERRSILGVLKAARPRAMGPSEIARQLGGDAANVRQLLHKMVKDHQIVRIKKGEYVPIGM